MRSPRSAFASPRSRQVHSSSSALSPYKGSPSMYSEGRISLRVDQPIELCQVAAHVFYRPIDGDSDENIVDFEFSWYRSEVTCACTNEMCPKKGDGNILLLTANVECLLCYQLGISREFSAFCGVACFKMAWNSHKHLHESHQLTDLVRGSLNLGELGLFDKTRPWKAMLEHSSRLFRATEDKWIDLKHHTKTYVPTANDIGHILRVECRVMRQSAGLIQSKVVDTGIVLPFPSPPPKRQMLANVHEERHTPRIRQIGVFRVLSYNVLAELYATRQLYPYCPMWVLSWNFRKELLKNELHSYNADILCLQEVQGDHYKTFFYPMMAEWGYDGWYLKKTRESMGLEGKVDGCALFYKRNRFILKEQHPLEFNTAACNFASSVIDLTYPSSTSFSRDASLLRLKTRLMRDNVGQIAILEAVPSTNELSKKAHSGPLLCVANVHIFSNPKFPDVKMWQTFTLVKKIEQVLSARDLPVVLCGDFNSEPTSAVYEFLSRNHVSASHEDLQPLASIFDSIEITHCLALASSYASVFRSEPEYTNYTGHWTGVVDYVWYTPSNLALFAALKMHPPETLEAYAKTPLPNCQHTSDHVPLCLDFSFKAPVVNGRYVT